MRSELKIEEAKNSDHASVVALLEKTELPPDEIELHMENFLVIRHPESDRGPELLVGSVGLEIYEDSALLRSLAVHPDFQGNGFGTRLVDRIIEVAKGKDITRLFLLTDTAEDFFKKRGFVIVTRDKVPHDMKQSIEFTTLCTSSPSMMREI
ncbi:MAG: GNAT family N-acetyltransferase [Candidatus Thorarchaeota archaeon]|nr:MAG: GNAT family N-acetyltransferase [Candidatus Thorarchaeota archaeon]